MSARRFTFLIVCISVTFVLMFLGYVTFLTEFFTFIVQFQTLASSILVAILISYYIYHFAGEFKLHKVGDALSMGTIRTKLVNTKRIVRRFKRNYLGIVGLVIILFFVTIALFPNLFLPSDVSQYNHYQLRDMDRGRTEQHPLGLTYSGVDILSLLVLGTRPIIFFSLQAAIISISAGGILGALSGYLGGVVDRIITALTEIILAFPNLFIMITILAITGNHEHRLWLVSIYGAATTIKIVRSEALRLRGSEYVAAAKSLGCGDLQIVFQHILLNASPVLIVQATLFMGQAVLLNSYLSFLGARGPIQDWASLLANSFNQFSSLAIHREPWLVWSAGICLFLLLGAFILVGNALRDAFDIRAV